MYILLYSFEQAGKRNENVEGKESRLFISNSLWNANGHEVISINHITNIYKKKERGERNQKEARVSEK